MQQSYVIGIDIGTGSIKAVAINFAAEIVDTAQHFYPDAPNANERDGWQVFEAFQDCIKELVRSQQSPPVAISLSCAMHSVMLVDKEDKALTNAILWSDTRSSAIAEELRHSDLGKDIYRSTGTPLHSMSPLCKIKWLHDNNRTLFDQANKFISLKEFIWFQLFGEYKVDYSIASATGLWNGQFLAWEESALSFCGISASKLSAPVPPTYKRSGINEQYAQVMNIPADTVFFIGASDGCLANLGSLCLDPSVAAVTIGTSAAVRVTLDQPVVDAERMIFHYLLDERTFVCGGATNNGGNILQWLVEKFCVNGNANISYEELFSQIKAVPAGCSGLVFLPYIHGERAPVWDEHGCGVFFGVKSFHDHAFFARAVMEGVCFGLNDILLSLEKHSGGVQQLKVSGAATQSDVLVQMLADITGKEVIIQEEGDASAVGAAYLALKELAVIQSYFDVPSRVKGSVYPASENTEVYKKLFSIYQMLYPSLKEPMYLLHQSTANECRF